jgi:hypothetical protein
MKGIRGILGIAPIQKRSGTVQMWTGVLALVLVIHGTSGSRLMELGYVCIGEQTRRVRRDVPTVCGLSLGLYPDRLVGDT